MDSIREIAFTFCTAAVFCAALSLVNGKSLEKSGRYIIALVLLCSVIGAISKGKVDIALPSISYGGIEYRGEEAVCQYQAEYIIKNLFDKKGVLYENISAKATKTQDGSIIINEIRIDGGKDKDKINEVLANEGIDCRVVFG
jgi:hypothetical protein